jgi:hypothetical protein
MRNYEVTVKATLQFPVALTHPEQSDIIAEIAYLLRELNKGGTGRLTQMCIGIKDEELEGLL